MVRPVNMVQRARNSGTLGLATPPAEAGALVVAAAESLLSTSGNAGREPNAADSTPRQALWMVGSEEYKNENVLSKTLRSKSEPARSYGQL